MLDIKLDSTGDIEVSALGDISVTKSIRQAILVRLRWIYSEWRLGPEFGFPWFDEVFVKNPNTTKIRQLIRNEILSVDGVLNAEVTKVTFDKQNRAITFAYNCTTSYETFQEEVTLYG